MSDRSRCGPTGDAAEPARPGDGPALDPQTLLEQTFAALSEAVFVVDPDSRTITACNHAVESVFGYTREEVIGRNTEFLHVDRSAYEAFGKALFRALDTEGAFRFEFRMRRSDGAVFPSEHAVTEIRARHGGRVGLVSVVRDITERRRAEEERNLLAALLKDMAEGVYVVKASDWTIIYANPKFERMFGYAAGELTGRHVSVVNAPSERTPEETAREIGESMKTTGEWHGEILNIRKDGVPFWCYASASMIEHPVHGRVYVNVHQDVTEQKRIGENLRESEDRYHSLVASSMDAVLLTAPDGRIVSANRAATEMFGRSEEELIRLGRDATADLSSPEIVNALAERARTGRFRGVLTFRRADGTTFPGEISSVVFTNARGEVQTSMVIRDITEREAAARQLRERHDAVVGLTARLAEAQEEERKRLARTLHDDLGQDLAAIGLNLAMIRNCASAAGDQALADDIRDSMSLLERVTGRVRHVMEDLRPPILDDYGLTAALDWLTDHFEARTGIRVERSFGATPEDAISRDATIHVYRIVQEALSNAAKHAGANGVVVSVSVHEGTLKVVVRDEGVGFDPDAPNGASCWGLTNMRERAEMIGGKCAITSSPGAGTTVELTLPRPRFGTKGGKGKIE